MQLLAAGTYWGASCGQSSPATPLFRVARHAASLPEGRNSQSCTPRAGRGRKPDSRRAARISYRPHPSRPPHRYWIPGTVAGLHRGNRAIWRRGSRGATIRVRPLPLGPFAIVSRSFARETWHVRLHRETAKHLPCVEYPVSGEKVRSALFPFLRVVANSSPAFATRCSGRFRPSVSGMDPLLVMTFLESGNDQQADSIAQISAPLTAVLVIRCHPSDVRTNGG